MKASATLTPSGIVNLGISRTWQPAQLNRFKSLAPSATAVRAGVVCVLGRYLAGILSLVRPSTKVITSSTAAGSLAQANWGIRSRSSHVLYFSLFFR